MTDPRRFVQPDVSDARINRLWGDVSARLAARPNRAWRSLAAGLLLCSAVAAPILFVQNRSAPRAGPVERAVLAEAKLETATDVLAVTLVDGSKLSLASRSAVEVRGNQPTSVALSLSRGEVTCDVTPRADRLFTVTAGDVEVRVVGTKFSVKTSSGDDPRVEVSVLRGVVEVVSKRRPGIVARVAAGQSWIQSPEPKLAPAEPPSVADATKDAVKVSPAPPASGGTSAPSARELFEKAGESRRAGDAAGAARAYDELLRLHPGDGRAGLSAFELGRLRMDRLADPAGAIMALERALALNLGPTFREDALARLVSVYASQANFGACARARDRYLSSYPTGVHASAVATRCGAR